MKRYTGLSDCRMFAAVLEERLPMAIYQDQQALITMLRVSLPSCLCFFQCFLLIILCVLGRNL